MDITSLGTTELGGYSKQSLNLKAISDVGDRQPNELAQRDKFSEGKRGKGLGHLQQDIRAILRQKVALKMSTAVGAYTLATPSTESLLGELRSGVAQILNDAPLEATDTIDEVRGAVDSAKTAAAELEDPTEKLEIGAAAVTLSDTLDTLSDEATRNVESSATVLSAESLLKQRSTIRIRTQEGDIVRLDLRRKESISVFDASASDASGTASVTEVSLSAKSKLVLQVKGDINDEEMAAIQNVFAQAEAIADDFFGGDIAAAFDAASGLDYDSEQLARVNMNFRETETSRVSYQAVAAYAAIAPAPTLSESEAPGVVSDVTDVPETATVTENIPAPVEAESQEAPAVPVADTDNFADKLGEFLRNTLDGFENGDSNRYYYSESFKLSLLKTVLEFRNGDAAETTGETTDSVSESVTDSE